MQARLWRVSPSDCPFFVGPLDPAIRSEIPKSVGGIGGLPVVSVAFPQHLAYSLRSLGRKRQAQRDSPSHIGRQASDDDLRIGKA